ncbi:hypothetical protein BHE74_00037402 [Ensete ventricosum]|nr:hypothetical protein BHE74_00037402 [Ensete ventricosum]
MVLQKNATVIYFARIARRVEFRSVFSAPSEKFKILAIPDILAHGKLYEHSSAKKHYGHKHCAKPHSESSFDRFFVNHLENSKILAFPNVLAHGMSYEHDFTKKCDGHKLFAKVKFRSVFHAPSRKFEILAIPGVLTHESSFDRFHEVGRRVEFRSVFRAPSRKFKIQAIPDVLGHGKSYEHESSFDQFFVHHPKNSKYWPFLTYLPMVSRTSMVPRKNMTVINFAEAVLRVEFRSIFRAPSRKLKILAIHNVLAYGMSYEHGFTKKCDGHKLFVPESNFDQFFLYHLGNSKYWTFPTD